jgi:ABC-type spermidine/putrescine transport system permease subunit II
MVILLLVIEMIIQMYLVFSYKPMCVCIIFSFNMISEMIFFRKVYDLNLTYFLNYKFLNFYQKH